MQSLLERVLVGEELFSTVFCQEHYERTGVEDALVSSHEIKKDLFGIYYFITYLYFTPISLAYSFFSYAILTAFELITYHIFFRFSLLSKIYFLSFII